ncbi:MAG: gephyrin-like molybdotransferase Glp, partial [Gemmatimonadaceae bacterium]
MLGVAEASARILAGIEPLGVERVALLDAAGRVLATPVTSPLTLPAWDNSAMDGYAVRAADIENASERAPVSLRVLESVQAGEFPSRPIAAGTAIRIMTGAPVPEGADSVVRVEDTNGATDVVVITS